MAGSLNKTVIAPVERVKYLFVVLIYRNRPQIGILPIGSLSKILLSLSEPMESEIYGEGIQWVY